MAFVRRCNDARREQATRMVLEVRADPATLPGAIPRIAGQLGMNPGTLQGRVAQVEADEGRRPGRVLRWRGADRRARA
jgi:transposase